MNDSTCAFKAAALEAELGDRVRFVFKLLAEAVAWEVIEVRGV